MIGKLKKDGLLRSYTRTVCVDSRLTASAKQLLLQKYPFDLAPYLTGTSRTLLKSGTRAPAAAAPDGRGAFDPAQRRPVGKAVHSGLALKSLYFRSTIPPQSSNLSVFCTKIRNSRMTGVLFIEQAIFPVYNMASTFPRWAYNAEID